LNKRKFGNEVKAGQITNDKGTFDVLHEEIDYLAELIKTKNDEVTKYFKLAIELRSDIVDLNAKISDLNVQVQCLSDKLENAGIRDKKEQ